MHYAESVQLFASGSANFPLGELPGAVAIIAFADRTAKVSPITSGATPFSGYAWDRSPRRHEERGATSTAPADSNCRIVKGDAPHFKKIRSPATEITAGSFPRDSRLADPYVTREPTTKNPRRAR